MIDILTFRGTGEKVAVGRDRNMISAFTDLLSPHFFSWYEPEWKAEIGPATGGQSLKRSVTQAHDAGIEAIQRTNRLVGLVGYSLGSLGVNRILKTVETDRRYRDANGNKTLEIAFIVNFANPGRPDGMSAGKLALPGRSGLYWDHEEIKTDIPRFEYMNPGDLICDAPLNSPWRRLADVIEPFSLLEGMRTGDGTRQIEQARGLLTQQQLADAHRFWTPEFWGRYREARKQMEGYLRPYPSEHTCYAVRRMPNSTMSFTEHAAHEINRRWGR